MDEVQGSEKCWRRGRRWMRSMGVRNVGGGGGDGREIKAGKWEEMEVGEVIDHVQGSEKSLRRGR